MRTIFSLLIFLSITPNLLCQNIPWSCNISTPWDIRSTDAIILDTELVIGGYKREGQPSTYKALLISGCQTPTFSFLKGSFFAGFFSFQGNTYACTISEFDSTTIYIYNIAKSAQSLIDSITISVNNLNIRGCKVIDTILFLTGDFDQGNTGLDVFILRYNLINRNYQFNTFPLLTDQFGFDIEQLNANRFAFGTMHFNTNVLQSFINELLILDSNMAILSVDTFSQGTNNNMLLNKIGSTLYYYARDYYFDSINISAYRQPSVGKVVEFGDTILTEKRLFGHPNVHSNHALNGLAITKEFYLYAGGTSPIEESLQAMDFGSIDNDYVIAKFDTNLTQQWVRFYGVPDAYEFLWKVLALDDGGCLLVGTTYDYVNATEQKRDLYIVRLDSNGNTFNTAIAPGVLPDNAYRLYPNPANSHLTLRLPNSAYGHLQLFNRTGQMVLHDRVEDYQTISVAHLPPGLYLYQLTDAEQRIASGKVVVQ